MPYILFNSRTPAGRKAVSPGKKRAYNQKHQALRKLAQKEKEVAKLKVRLTFVKAKKVNPTPTPPPHNNIPPKNATLQEDVNGDDADHRRVDIDVPNAAELVHRVDPPVPDPVPDPVDNIIQEDAPAPLQENAPLRPEDAPVTPPRIGPVNTQDTPKTLNAKACLLQKQTNSSHAHGLACSKQLRTKKWLRRKGWGHAWPV